MGARDYRAIVMQAVSVTTRRSYYWRLTLSCGHKVKRPAGKPPGWVICEKCSTAEFWKR